MKSRFVDLKVSHRLLLLLPVLMAVVGLFIGLDLNRTKQDLMDGRERALRYVVDSAITIVGNFYEKEQSKQLTHQQAQEQAKDALRALTYDNGDGRMFAHEFSGVTLVNAVRDVEGKNRLDVPNVRDQVAAAKAGGGFTSYKMPVGPRTGDERLAFTSVFKPWEWAIGTGIYVEDVNAIFWRVAAEQIGIAALALVVACAVVLLIARSISRPMALMTVSMGALADGNLEVAVPFLKQKNEFGRLGAALQVFKDAAIEKVRLEAEAVEARRLVDEERSRNEVKQAEQARQLVQVVEGLAGGLSSLAAGNLVQRLDHPFAAEYETLRADFNGAISQLEQTMREILENTGAIRSGTGEIASASDDLSRRTEQQAASLEETAAALDEITATVKKTAEGAAHARTVVGTARADAEHSGAVVGRAVEAMSGIEQSSRQIGQIIGIIDEIAFQTNLLALNAGVEAARAGDAGRGFAVVASEVRALAQRSAQAAKEIKTLIMTSDGQVKEGVKLVSETGQALSRIVTQFVEINAVVSEIAGSAQEQATGLAQVNTAVNQMDQVTQQNAAMVEESTAAAHGLTHETDELGKLIARFRVGDMSTQDEPGSTVKKAQAMSRPALKVVKAQSKPATMVSTAKTGTHDWEEF